MLEKQNSGPLAVGSGFEKNVDNMGELDSICNSKTITQDDPDSLKNEEKASGCFSIKEGNETNISPMVIQNSGSHHKGNCIQPDSQDSTVDVSVREEIKLQEVEHGENALSLLGVASCPSPYHVKKPKVDENKDYAGSLSAESELERLKSEACSRGESVESTEKHFKSLNAVNVDLTLGLPVTFQDHMAGKVFTVNGSLQEEIGSMRKQNHLECGKSSYSVRRKKVLDTDSRDSECGSCTGPSDDTDSWRVWKAMKQNGFLSSQLHAPLRKRVLVSNLMPSKRLKNDLLKKNIELAKKEQVDKFKRMAAPSGLLTGLNPGIINHVRNSKQVQSIIEALVKSEKLDSSNSQKTVSNEVAEGNKKINGSKRDSEGTVGPNANCLCLNGNSAALVGSDDHIPVDFLKQVRSKYIVAISTCSGSEHERSTEQEELNKTPGTEAFVGSQFNFQLESMLSSMLRKGQTTLERTSYLPNEELSTNHGRITDLSVKAAFVAHEWLELLRQDINGRLSDFLSSQENDSHGERNSSTRNENNWLPQNHLVKWRSLFVQMENALQQEGKYLENWLRQVKQMQAHCERGLHGINMERTELPGNSSRSKKDETVEGEFAVRAAAASIYSTCNFAMSSENIPCF
ncbi:uncharacterized protein LOC116264858 isoform X2 [Nymphaea colorata]|uniref:uncharacterized protein LOC116264858 isoform X2 n=1 Tax=Nymphaea colorata TaxID=210225 RepID=UPI00129E3775|nr:uncharacterized protein LOC116264858 isoform X2 [Nymphaea colorata]